MSPLTVLPHNIIDKGNRNGDQGLG